ncbi:MAG: hypothetical protein HZB62_09875 [Nitrospirae bacterium]|nr:hypothetical protein [Nitrospirota bacterium]
MIKYRKSSEIKILFIFFIFLFFPVKNADALSDSSRLHSRYFLLTGDISVDYEREWGDRREQDKLRHEYHIKLSGYVSDPRLVMFELSGSFMQDIRNPGVTENTYGFGTRIFLLNSRVLRGPLAYFPQPIQLRFDYSTSGRYTSYNYGLSLYYNMPGRSLAFFRNGKVISLVRQLPVGSSALGNENNGNAGNDGTSSNDSNNSSNMANRKERGGLVIPFPSFTLDYDRYIYDNGSSGFRSENTNLDFRAVTFMKNSDYFFEYRYINNTNNSDNNAYSFKEHLFELRADYHFPDTKAATTLDVFNRIFYRSGDSGSLFDISSRGIWLKRFGKDQKDSLSILGGLRYFTADLSSGYSGNVGSQYTRNLSERLSNTVSVSLGYGNTERDVVNSLSDTNVVGSAGDYFVSVSDSIRYQLSNRLTLSGVLSAGGSDKQRDYGARVGLATRTRIGTLTEYAYSHSGIAGEERDIQRVGFSFSTLLPGSIYLASRNFYQTDSLQTGEKEKLLSLRGDMYWNVLAVRFNLGANYLSIQKTGGLAADTNTTLIYLGVSRQLGRRLFVNARISYAKANTGLSTLEFDPSLSWSFRKTYLTARYTLRKTEGSGQMDHRFSFALRRTFDQVLRPFF